MNNEPMARVGDPVTSHQAAALARELQRQHHELITECLRQHGPLGKDGIAHRIGIDGVAVARRLPELKRMGRVAETGNLVISNSGRNEREWRPA